MTYTIEVISGPLQGETQDCHDSKDMLSSVAFLARCLCAVRIMITQDGQPIGRPVVVEP